MCLAVIFWQPGASVPLKGVANRDEFRARPTAPLAHWPEPSIAAGRDMEAGGTWLAFDTRGRFALLTNLRSGSPERGLRSRGELVVDYLSGDSDPQAFCARLARRTSDYAGFNLLLGTSEELVYTSSHSPGARWLEPGIHALSNALLGTPWPKCRLAEAQMAAEHTEMEKSLNAHSILGCTRLAPEHSLPMTGVSRDLEHRLSAQTITGSEYGTRSRTHWLRRADGAVMVLEQQLDEAGQVVAEAHWGSP